MIKPPCNLTIYSSASEEPPHNTHSFKKDEAPIFVANENEASITYWNPHTGERRKVMKMDRWAPPSEEIFPAINNSKP